VNDDGDCCGSRSRRAGAPSGAESTATPEQAISRPAPPPGTAAPDRRGQQGSGHSPAARLL